MKVVSGFLMVACDAFDGIHQTLRFLLISDRQAPNTCKNDVLQSFKEWVTRRRNISEAGHSAQGLLIG